MLPSCVCVHRRRLSTEFRWTKIFLGPNFRIRFFREKIRFITHKFLTTFLVSTNELLVQAVTSFLSSTDTIYKFPNCEVVYSKFCLQSLLSCFNMVVGTVISIKRPLVDMALLPGNELNRGPQMAEFMRDEVI